METFTFSSGSANALMLKQVHGSVRLLLNSSDLPSDEVTVLLPLLLLMAINEQSTAQEATSNS